MIPWTHGLVMNVRNGAWVCSWLMALVLIGPAQGQSSADAIEQYNLAARYQKLEQYDLALKEWQRLATEHADDALAASGWHHAGVCQFQQAAYPAAIESFETFLEKYPKHELTEATLTNLGLARYNLAQQLEDGTANASYRQAIEAFDRQRKEFPQGKLAAQGDFYRAESLYALGEKQAAVKAYREWLEQHGDNPLAADVRLALSVAQSETGSAAEAIKSLEALLATNPEPSVAAEARVRLGDALVAVGEFQEAARRYAAALEAGSALENIDYARTARAGALFNAGDYTAAAEAYEQAGDTASAGKALYQAGQYPAAAERLGSAFRAATNDADLAHWWVRALIEAGAPDKALESADNALQNTSSAELLLAKADALYALDGRREESVAGYVAAGDAGEGEIAAEAYYLAAATALELGDFEQAKQQAQAVIDQHAESTYVPDARLTLAEAQLQSGDGKAAAATFAELLKTAEGNERLAWTVRQAWAHSAAGDEQAVIAALGPLQVKPDNSDGQQALFLLGRAQYRTGDHPAAAGTLAAVADLNPPGDWSHEAKLLVGRSQAATGNHSQAIESFSGLIESQPEAKLSAQAHYRRGESHEKTGDAAAAIADFDRVVSNNADHPLAPYAQYRAARLVLASNQPAEAAERFAKLAQQYPDHKLANQGQLGRASSLATAGEHQAALDALAKLDANDPQVALARGTSLAGLKKWDEAIEPLQTAVQADGEFADRDQAWYELAWAYREAGKRSESREAFAKLALEFPDSPLAREAKFRIGESHYDAGEYEPAAEWFTKAADGANSEPALHEKALHLLAWARYKRGQHEQAANGFEAQLQAYPTGSLAADAKWMRGESLFAAEKYEPALAVYATAKGQAPNSKALAPLGMLHAGQAAGQLDNWQEAADWLQLAAKDYPDYAGRSEVDYELGWAFTKLNQPEQAMPLLVKVAESDTSALGARARFVIGELQFADKQYEQAVRSFFQVAYGYGDRDAPEAYHTWQADSLFEAARCLEQLDRTSAAKKVYAELMERFGDHAKADLARKRLETLGAE